MLEQPFKMQRIRDWKASGVFNEIFCIETEETEPGFPDVMARNNKLLTRWKFFEFKASDDKGRIKFKKSQPAFYKNHPRMQIEIIALDNRTGQEIVFPASALFDKDSQFAINQKLEVQLP